MTPLEAELQRKTEKNQDSYIIWVIVTIIEL